MEQIFISDAAQAHFRKLLDTQEEGTNIRIFCRESGDTWSRMWRVLLPAKFS